MTDELEGSGWLCDDIDVRRAIEYAAAVLLEIENSMDEEQENHANVGIAAKRMVSICEALIMYADCYEGDEIDIETVFDFAEESLGLQNAPTSNLLH